MFEVIGKQYRKTQGFISSMVLAASGWKGAVDAETYDGDQIFVYAWDSAHDWTWMCSMDFAALETIFPVVRNNKQDWPAVRGKAGGCLARAAAHNAVAGQEYEPEKEKPPGSMLASWEADLSLSLMAYMATTTVARQPGAVTPNSHLVIMHYPQADKGALLRPFIMAGEGHKSPLQAARFRDAVCYVSEMDRNAHPEWFPGEPPGG